MRNKQPSSVKEEPTDSSPEDLNQEPATLQAESRAWFQEIPNKIIPSLTASIATYFGVQTLIALNAVGIAPTVAPFSGPIGLTLISGLSAYNVYVSLWHKLEEESLNKPTVPKKMDYPGLRTIWKLTQILGANHKDTHTNKPIITWLDKVNLALKIASAFLGLATLSIVVANPPVVIPLLITGLAVMAISDICGLVQEHRTTHQNINTLNAKIEKNSGLTLNEKDNSTLEESLQTLNQQHPKNANLSVLKTVIGVITSNVVGALILAAASIGPAAIGVTAVTAPQLLIAAAAVLGAGILAWLVVTKIKSGLSTPEPAMQNVDHQSAALSIGPTETIIPKPSAELENTAANLASTHKDDNAPQQKQPTPPADQSVADDKTATTPIATEPSGGPAAPTPAAAPNKDQTNPDMAPSSATQAHSTPSSTRASTSAPATRPAIQRPESLKSVTTSTSPARARAATL